jgi:hypothetical protein
MNVRGQWDHDFVQAQFSGVLIARRKLYPSSLTSLLSKAALKRLLADYEIVAVGQVAAERTLQMARVFVSTVRKGIL